MNSAKSKKRKITDYFPMMSAKVSRTKSFLLKFKGTQTEGTQTEGVYEIEPLSKKKEGLKFLVYRFYNYESKKFSYSYEMCSIADEPVLSKPGIKVTGVEYFDLYSLCSLALNHLKKIQRNTTYFERHDCYELDTEEPISPAENSIKIDQVTQYGEDVILDNDFWEGMKFMAMRILEHESGRLSVEIDDNFDFSFPKSFVANVISTVVSVIVMILSGHASFIPMIPKSTSMTVALVSA